MHSEVFVRSYSFTYSDLRRLRDCFVCPVTFEIFNIFKNFKFIADGGPRRKNKKISVENFLIFDNAYNAYNA